jgi:predicted DNA binding CopG/RHH family protein
MEKFGQLVRGQQIGRKGKNMTRHYGKRLKEYEGTFEFDTKAIIEAMQKTKDGRKVPTSIALEASSVKKLKNVASKLGIPYQVLMRLFINEGLRRFKPAEG